jgi:hypothetical protein
MLLRNILFLISAYEIKGDPTISVEVLSVGCNGNILKAELRSENTLEDFTITSCPAIPVTHSKVGDVTMIEFDPYSCAGTTPDPSDITTYNVAGISVSLGSTTVQAGGVTIYFDDLYKVTVGCTFPGSLDIGADATVIRELEKVDNSYIGEPGFELISLTGERVRNGDIVTFELSSLDGLLTVDSNIVYAPISCQFIRTDSQHFMNMFNHDMGKCGHSELDFQMAHADLKYTMSFKSFQLQVEEANTDYQFKCTVALCHKSDLESLCATTHQVCELEGLYKFYPDIVPHAESQSNFRTKIECPGYNSDYKYWYFIFDGITSYEERLNNCQNLWPDARPAVFDNAEDAACVYNQFPPADYNGFNKMRINLGYYRKQTSSSPDPQTGYHTYKWKENRNGYWWDADYLPWGYMTNSGRYWSSGPSATSIGYRCAFWNVQKELSSLKIWYDTCEPLASYATTFASQNIYAGYMCFWRERL